MKLEQLCQKYDELYDALTEVLKESNYSDVAIVDELSTGIRGTLKSEINESYLKFFEYVVKKQGVYDGGQSPSELFSFLKMSISNGNTSFPLVKGLEAPLSLTVIYLVRGELESVEYFFARDKWEAEDDSQCSSGYKIGLGYDGKNFYTLKYNLSGGKVLKKKWNKTESKETEKSKAKHKPGDFNIKDGKLIRYKGKVCDVIIPEGVVLISAEAFCNCHHIKSVSIPDGVTSIGDRAFSGCASLECVVIPDSVTRLGWSAFGACTSLKSVVLSNSLKSISLGAFYGCSSLTNIILPDSIKKIENNAFAECCKLNEIVIPGSVTVIEKGAFKNCFALSKIVIPDAVKEIQEEAFAFCPSPADITVGAKNKKYKAIHGRLYTIDGKLVKQ